MIFTETKLKGAYIIELNKIKDERGFFGRSWCKNEFTEHNLNANIVQTNTSFNKRKGTLRGLHFQRSPFAETKLVKCTKGAIFDVIVDLRSESPTFKQWLGVELTGENYKMLYIPERFAHGFITLEDNSEVNYLISEFYNPGVEGSIRWDDPEINIQWPIAMEEISDRDSKHVDFSKIILP